MRLLPCLLLLAGCAQPAPRVVVSDKTPALEYRSAFADYIRHSDDALSPWRDANEAVKP